MLKDEIMARNMPERAAEMALEMYTRETIREVLAIVPHLKDVDFAKELTSRKKKPELEERIKERRKRAKENVFKMMIDGKEENEEKTENEAGEDNDEYELDIDEVPF